MQLAATYSKTEPHYLAAKARDKWWKRGAFPKVCAQAQNTLLVPPADPAAHVALAHTPPLPACTRSAHLCVAGAAVMYAFISTSEWAHTYALRHNSLLSLTVSAHVQQCEVFQRSLRPFSPVRRID